MRKHVFIGAVAIGVMLISAAGALPKQKPKPKPKPPPVVVAAGDIACDPASGSFNGGAGSRSNCHQRATAALIAALNPKAVLNLGDAQYERGTLDNFARSYNDSWGAFKSKTWAVAGGSHDFYGGGDWYTYFGRRAGPAPYSPYSFNIGSWHVVVLNAQCRDEHVAGCTAASPQGQWLRRDLARYRTRCTMALWHNPRWSSGSAHGDDKSTDAFIRVLYAAGAELILNGHDHDYERFAPQNPDGQLDRARGIVEFVVGTGGKSLSEFGEIRPNSLVRNSDTYGVLKLTLRPRSYAWQFVPEAGKTFTDSGSASCH